MDLLPTPPPAELLETTSAWPMLANDQFNCCTSAAAGHMVHHWTAANHDSVFLTDQDIIRAHAALTGDRLMDCVSMLDALKYWRKSGIGDHLINSFVEGRPKDEDQMRCIIHLFGSAYIGLDLPHFACAGDPLQWPSIPWAIPPQITAEDSAPQPTNGHCVTAIGYDADGLYVVTWGVMKTMSWDFYKAYNVETFAVLSEDWVQENEDCPTGFSCAKLAQDLHEVERRHQIRHQA